MFHVSFLSRVKTNSTKWPSANEWVFIAQIVENCSINAEAMGLNPVEVPKKIGGGGYLQLLKVQYPP